MFIEPTPPKGAVTIRSFANVLMVLALFCYFYIVLFHDTIIPAMHKTVDTGYLIQNPETNDRFYQDEIPFSKDFLFSKDEESGDRTFLIPIFEGDIPYFVLLKVNDFQYKRMLKEMETASKDPVTGLPLVEVSTLVSSKGKYYERVMDSVQQYGYYDDMGSSDSHYLSCVMTTFNVKTLRMATRITIVLVWVFLFASDHLRRKSQGQQKYMIVINKTSYEYSKFKTLERCIVQGDREDAIKQLTDITGISPEYAETLAENWYDFVYRQIFYVSR